MQKNISATAKLRDRGRVNESWLQGAATVEEAEEEGEEKVEEVDLR